MSSTAFYEGDDVSFVGVFMPPAHGKLLSFASRTAAHVKWTTGAREGEIDLVDIYDLMPATASVEPDVMSFTAVRRVMSADGEAGVINFLATAQLLDSWQEIAADTLAFVAARIRSDASMDLPHEQLQPQEVDRVVVLASRVLLRDAFGELPDE